MPWRSVAGSRSRSWRWRADRDATDLLIIDLQLAHLLSFEGQMLIDRRHFSGLLAGVVGGVALPRQASQAAMLPADPCHLPDQITALKPMTAGVVPITTVERQARLARARELMGEAKLGAIIVEPG